MRSRLISKSADGRRVRHHPARDQRGRRPTQTNPETLPTLLHIGRLVSCIVRVGSQRVKVTPKACARLAWDVSTAGLVVAYGGTKGGTKARADVPAKAAAAHARFHGRAAAGLLAAEVPEPGDGFRCLGRCEALTYDPVGIDSTKGGARWFHQFGDGGERGHGPANPEAPSPYPVRLMPELWTDATGALWIKRTAGCRYTVTDWIFR